MGDTKDASDDLRELAERLRDLTDRQGLNGQRTDVGNAERMAERYVDTIRWRCDTQSFVRRDQHHWRPATTKELVGLAVKTLKAQGRAALDLELQERLQFSDSWRGRRRGTGSMRWWTSSHP